MEPSGLGTGAVTGGGGGAKDRQERHPLSETHSSFKSLCPKHPQATIENTVLPGPDDETESWEMGDDVGTPCPPETPIWVALDFGGPLKEKKGLREGHEEGVGRWILGGHLLGGGLRGRG